MADDRVHGATHDPQRRLVATREVELRLARGERIDGELCPHEGEQVRPSRGLPLELKAGPRSRGGSGGPFLDLPHVDLDVGAQLDAADLDPELRRYAVRSRSSGSRWPPANLPRACGQCV